MKLEQMVEKIDKIHALVHDKEGIGMASWGLALGEQMTELIKGWQEDNKPTSYLSKLCKSLKASAQEFEDHRSQLNLKGRMGINSLFASIEDIEEAVKEEDQKKVKG